MHHTVETVTARIEARSRESRSAYLAKVDGYRNRPSERLNVGCSNLAHGMAACSAQEKSLIQQEDTHTLAIVTAYNDMLSAHKPYESYPEIIRRVAKDQGAVAQVAGGVPAMCDGVTQGREGMELSLFSRDVIALSTAVALSHDLFDAVLCLGICDKIVPGLLIGALSFGHLPTIFVPAGPMPSGLSNKDKAAVREAYADGKADRGQLLAAESAAYHSPGTCTFYGTANSNQMLLEFMGLQLPGSSFETPDSALRTPFTQAATEQALALARGDSSIGHMVDERAIVNAMIGLLATGGSTNHTLHLVAVAAAAGIQITWQDFSDLAAAVPLIARVYPNGHADVNQFHQAGGIRYAITELLAEGLLHEDVTTILGHGLSAFSRTPSLSESGGIQYADGAHASGDHSVLRPVKDPFQADGGLRVLDGNLGQAIVKTSAVDPKHQRISAPARVFRNQADFVTSYEEGELNRDFVAVVTHQGPNANGMPELHKLSPYLGLLQDQGHSVALLTDGRMSGASGKVLAAIHVTPEASRGGEISKIADGDLITIDATTGEMNVDADLEARHPCQLQNDNIGTGREMFNIFRAQVGSAASGASIFAGDASRSLL
jgi:phosphogluconate dehydratase